MRLEQKMQLGLPYGFSWVATKPVTVSPSLSIYWADGAETITLSNAGNYAVSAYDGRNKTLTLASLPDPPVGTLIGPAWLITASLGALSVRVVSHKDLTVTLADSLGQTYVPQAGDLLASAIWHGSIDARSSCERDVRWVLSFLNEHGIAQSETGTIHVVFQPFSTGLVSEEVSRKLNALGTFPNGAQGWNDYIEGAEDELIATLRAELAPLGLIEDDLTAPQALRPVHLLLTAAHYLQVSDPDRAKAQRDQALSQLKLVLSRVHLDHSRVGTTPHNQTQSLPSSIGRWGRM